MDTALHVLYAEDNLADADLTKTYFGLNSPDMDLEVVDTGAQCLTRLVQRHYDVLLLDNHLPDMEGIEVLKEVAQKNVSLPVVMVTGVGDETLVIQALRLGASDYVPKQGDYVTTLPAVVTRAAADYRRLQQLAQVTGQRQRRILYVERHPADADLTQRHFAEVAAHFSLSVVRSSREALAVLQEGHVDLVLADLRLADMDALDLLRDARHRNLSVPFIIITGKGDEQAALAALKLGASDYIVKRENYLTQLPYAIENAIARAQLVQANEHLQVELQERERLATENTRLLEEAKAAVRARDEFLAVAAHEVRGPLTAMRLAVQSLEKGKVSTHAVSTAFDIIERGDRKLTQFVDELLDLGRIRGGTLQFRLETVDLAEVLREVVAQFHSELGQSGSALSIRVEGSPMGQWDRLRLAQVIGNLLSNAIKFGLGRPIDIAVSADDAWANLRVTDHGAGISMGMQSQMFQPFQRELTARNYGGLGLGLYIVQSIVDGLGGRLSVRSEPERGSTFLVELPKQRDQ
jgi:signal transduction histidine kinase